MRTGVKEEETVSITYEFPFMSAAVRVVTVIMLFIRVFIVHTGFISPVPTSIINIDPTLQDTPPELQNSVSYIVKLELVIPT